jgi:hypothetical protein
LRVQKGGAMVALPRVEAAPVSLRTTAASQVTFDISTLHFLK